MIFRKFKSLYVQVIAGVLLGVLVGALEPTIGAQLKPFSSVFISLIKMVFAPVVFATVVLGIARMESMKELGKVGGAALLYFEILSTIALAIGLVMVNILQPGVGMNVDPATLDQHSIAAYTNAPKMASGMEFFLGIFPTSVVDAFAKNNILQILTFSIFFGIALSHLGPRGKPVVEALDSFAHAMFRIVNMIMRYAPLAAFGAVSFTVGKYGLGTLVQLGKLMGTMYLTCAVFVFIVLGIVCRLFGFRITRLLNYIKDEIFVLVGTASSESVVPQCMLKMENAGVSKSVVGLVIPSGLTFNPDGQCIYFTMAAIFIAQATGTPLTLTDQLIVLAVLLLTSKGSAGVSGTAFITLAATLASLGKIPVAGMVLLLGVDMFMGQARAITNTIGNCVATLVIGKLVGALDTNRMKQELDSPMTQERLETIYAGDKEKSTLQASASSA
jgi:aerobic C4-dicarboxylate transport protein